MARIDELIREITASETVEIEGHLSKQQQKRIEDKVLSAIKMEEQDKKLNSSFDHNILPIRRKRRRFLILGLAAVMLMGLCITAFGKSYPDWDIELLRVMGLSSADTLQLDSGEVEINESAVCEAIEYNGKIKKEKKVTITAVSSIGDKNSGYIRIDTDYKVPDHFDEKKDYILPEDARIYVYKKDPGKQQAGIPTSMGTTFSSEIRDGYLSFMLEISGCPNLNKSYVTIDLKDIYLYPNGLVEGKESEERLLLQGEWNLKWKYEYKSNVKSFFMIKPLEINGQNYYMTKIEISPISVQMEGFRMPWNREKEYTMFELNEIIYQDGSIVELAGRTTGGCNNGIYFDTFVGILQIGETIHTENVKAVIVNGNQINLR